MGNARSLGETGQGRAIDGCDLVIRLNAAPGAAPLSHGTRTDWLAASSRLPAGRLRDLHPQRMFWMSPRHRVLAMASYGWRLPLCFFPAGWWRALAARLGSRPSTGVMTIDMLLHVGGFAELQLFGFDFFRSGSLSSRGIAAPPPHDFARERVHVARLMAEDPRIRLVGGVGP